MQPVLIPVLAVGLAAVIAYLSLVPADAKAVGWMPPWLQNAGHVGCYALLAFLIFFATGPVLRSDALQAAVAVVLATAFGGVMEWLQRNARGRHTSYRDALQNAAGALIGIVTAMFVAL